MNVDDDAGVDDDEEDLPPGRNNYRAFESEKEGHLRHRELRLPRGLLGQRPILAANQGNIFFVHVDDNLYLVRCSTCRACVHNNNILHICNHPFHGVTMQ